MNEQGQFDLCPKCGAVARDGICQSCGYEIPGIQETIEQAQTKQQAQQTDNPLYTTPDVYQTQTGQDIYQTPDTNAGHHDTGGMFSGEQSAYRAEESAAYQQNTYNAGSPYDNNRYDSRQHQNDNNQYGNQPYQNDNNQYGNQPYRNDNNQYGNQPYQNDNNQYGSQPYRNDNNQYGSQPYRNDNNQYGNQPYRYDNNQYGSQQYQSGNNQYGKNPYGGNPYNNYQYGNNQYGTPYGANPYGNNPYSPYAVPPAKKHTGLIIGIIITVAILFLIALFAVFYHLLEAADEKKAAASDVEHLEEFYQDYFGDEWYEEHFGDNHDNHHSYHEDGNQDDGDDPDNDDYGDYGYDDDYDDYDDDKYYTLHDDIKRNLSYSIEWEYYEYEPDDKDVMILIDYPVIVGSHVPNLDKINEVIADEISVFTDYYEEEYSNYMYDEDSYFYASATGYVTYMSEDVLSVVYSENVYSDYYDSVFCYSINIDMQNGVILDNTDIIAVDDDFSIDFRYRSEEQNGSISTIDWMSDQEITELLTSSGNLIIFYIPQGMEIGFNYEDGWVTVTYHDYKDYLKIF